METAVAMNRWVCCVSLVGRETLAHQEIPVAARMIVDCRDDFELLPLVEIRRLERERHQDDLRAAAPSRLLLGRLEQLRAEATVPVRLVHPELAQLTRPAPCVPANPSDYAIARARDEREQLPIADAGGGRIEL